MADGVVAPITQVTTVSGVGSQTLGTTEGIVLLSGTIIGKDAGGNFLLRTDKGNLTLQSNLPLTYNSDVVIRVEQTGTHINNAKILTINGTPFAEFTQPTQVENDSVSGSLLAQTSQSTSATEPPPPLQPLPPNVIRAVVVSAPAVPQSQPQGEAAAIITGTNVIVSLPGNVPQPPATQSQISTPTQPTTPPTNPPVQQAATTSEPVIPAMVAVAPENPVPLQTPVQVQAVIFQPQISPTPIANTSSAATASPPPPPPTTNAAVIENVSQPAPNPPTQPQAQLNLPTAQTNVQSPVQQPSQNPPAQASINPLYAAYVKQNIKVELPAQTSYASKPVTPASIPARIVSAGKDGTIIVQTPSGTATLKAEALPETIKLPPGTNIIINSAENSDVFSSSPAFQTGFSSAPASFTDLAVSWNTLKDIVSVLTGNITAPDTPTNTAQSPSVSTVLNNLPNLGENFTSSSLSFISALAQGDARKILGDDVINTLRNSGRGDLVQKFVQEFSTLSNALQTSQSQQTTGSWQTTFLPFVFQEELQQARIYIKRDTANKKQQGGSAATGGTRFIVEVNLSEFGGIQMDGLIRRKQANTIFDLMIRSAVEFSPQERAEIASIYNEAASQTGFSGMLQFQVTTDFPVKPLEEILANKTSAVTA